MRAVAVIPVLLFHAGVPGFRGGFLGVDIFFVISGFLITSLLLNDAGNDRFSIISFYNRRVRRIFPALFAMLIVVTAITALIFPPTDFRRYAQSLVATTIFSSNILFFLESGYFDTSSLEKPLLHTWSLAVEEQFYLVWPLLLGAFFRFKAKRHLFTALLVGVVASFALAMVLPSWSSAATFYLPFSRAWELGLGALLAVKPVKIPGRRFREAAAVAGLLAIVAAIALCDDETPLALASGVTCLGTATLIAFNSEKTLAGRLMSLPLSVGIGLISYSLYLWHWPLLAFAHYYYSAEPPPLVRLGVLILATILACISYRFVEKPLRRPGAPKKAFVASAVVMSGLLAVGAIVIHARGLPQRFGTKFAEASLKFEHHCMGCALGVPGDPQIVLWGDSHAMAIAPAVRGVAVANKLPAIAFMWPACPPLVGAQPAGLSPKCRDRQQQALAAIAKLGNVRTIILAARWALASETTLFGSETGSRYFLTDGLSRERTVSNSRRALVDGLRRTVAALSALQPRAEILLVGQIPEPGIDPAQCFIRDHILNQSNPKCEKVADGSLQRLAFSDSLLSGLAASRPNVSALFLGRQLCAGAICPTRIGGTVIYRDTDHLSADGARLLLNQCLPGIIKTNRPSLKAAGTGLRCRTNAFVE